MSLYKRGSIWWANLTRPDKRGRVRVSTGETDRAAAQKRHNELQVELWQEVPATRGRTWGDAVDAWTSAMPRSDSELLSLAKFARKYPDRALNTVTGESIDAALGFCKTAATYMRYRAMLAAILNQAKRAGWIREVPVLPTRRDRKVKPRVWLTQEQFAALLAELPKHMKPMARFAVETGLRQGNVLGLTWSRVDLKRRLTWIEGEEMKEGKPFGLPLNDAAVEVLKEQLQARKDDCEWVFPYQGRRITEIKTAFIAACVRAKLGTITVKHGTSHYEGFTWHGLRHTWATWHMQNDTPADVVQALGGWADARMVRNYAHHSPSHLARFAGNNRKTR